MSAIEQAIEVIHILLQMEERPKIIASANSAIKALQAAHAEYGTTDSKKWRVDDLVQDVNGDIFTIEGFKGDKLLVKDASETLWLTPTGELTWHSRAAENQNSET